MTTFNFSTEIVDKVKNNWLAKEFKDSFAPCNNDTQLCLTFVSLAYKENMELRLAKEISDVMIKKIANDKDKLIKEKEELKKENEMLKEKNSQIITQIAQLR